MSGTEWTEAGQGSTLFQIKRAFGRLPAKYAFREKPPFGAGDNMQAVSNLRLTGSAITEEDWARLESAEFKVGE